MLWAWNELWKERAKARHMNISTGAAQRTCYQLVWLVIVWCDCDPVEVHMTQAWNSGGQSLSEIWYHTTCQCGPQHCAHAAQCVKGIRQIKITLILFLLKSTRWRIVKDFTCHCFFLTAACNRVFIKWRVLTWNNGVNNENEPVLRRSTSK